MDRRSNVVLNKSYSLKFSVRTLNAYYCDGKIVGLSVLKDAGTFVYLLFFAVNKDARSSGFGGRILDRIIEDCGERPLVFSIEDPAEECDNKEQRVKREAFYFKHNCVHTGYRFARPELGTTFLLMSSSKREDYSFIKEAVCAINPTLASFMEKF